MGKPARIQLRRTKGWKMPPNTVKVDRTTIWGNPFKRYGGSGDVMPANESLGFYREHLLQRGLVFHRRTVVTPEMVQRELRGKNLACWCKPGAPCHADVLLELANG